MDKLTLGQGRNGHGHIDDDPVGQGSTTATSDKPCMVRTTLCGSFMDMDQWTHRGTIIGTSRQLGNSAVGINSSTRGPGEPGLELEKDFSDPLHLQKNQFRGKLHLAATTSTQQSGKNNEIRSQQVFIHSKAPTGNGTSEKWNSSAYWNVAL